MKRQTPAVRTAEKRLIAAALKWWMTVRNPWKNPHGVPGCKAFGYFKRACKQLDDARMK